MIDATSADTAAFLTPFPDAPADTRIVAHFWWSDYEEGGNQFIVDIDGVLHEVGYASSVYSIEGPTWNPSPITEEAALQRMTAWETRAKDLNLQSEQDASDCSSSFSMP